MRDALWRDRTLVKAWTVRGTLHLHPADELPLWYAARSAMDTGDGEGLPPWRDPAGVVHPALTGRGRRRSAAVREALDGRCLLREELVEEVAGRTGPAARERLRSGFAFFLSDVCQGPPQGNKVTFARPDQWIEGWQEVDPERSAAAKSAAAILHTYGPARPNEFREWFGSATFKTADARTLFESLGDLEEVEVEGHHAYVVAGDTDFPEPVAECPASARVRRVHHGLPRARPPGARPRREPRLQHTVAGSTRDRRAFAFS